MSDCTHTARVWLAVVAAGRCTLPEIRASLPGMDPKLAENSVRAMVAAGMLRKYGEGRGTQFGVTLECAIPRGLTISRVIQAVKP
jgi:hypothetical protein